MSSIYLATFLVKILLSQTSHFKNLSFWFTQSVLIIQGASNANLSLKIWQQWLQATKFPCVKTYLVLACFFCVKYCDARMSAVRNEKLFELIKLCRKWIVSQPAQNPLWASEIPSGGMNRPRGNNPATGAGIKDSAAVKHPTVHPSPQPPPNKFCCDFFVFPGRAVHNEPDQFPRDAEIKSALQHYLSP